MNITCLLFSQYILQNQALYFSREQAEITSNCSLTDDPLMNLTSITSLGAGRTVTYLTTVINQNGKAWDYVETTVAGQTVRGFIRSGFVAIPADTLPDVDSAHPGSL